jgi:CHASE3 domain sensor protein
MQVDRYQTLTFINVRDDQAKLVVASIEEYIDDMVGDATKPLQEKIDRLQRSLETHMKTQTWVISIVGFTIVALTTIGTLVSILRH